MKMKKKLLALVAVVAVLCMALAGCGGADLTPADQNVSALFELMVDGDTSAMMNLYDFASEEDVYEAFFEDGASVMDDLDLVDEIKDEFSTMGLEISESDLQDFSDAMTSLLKKITYTTEITSESKDSVVVTVKVNGISEDDLTNIMVDAATTMSEELENNLTEEDAYAIMAGDMSVVTSYMEQYLRDIITGIQAMTPVAEAYEFDVTCEKLRFDVSGKEETGWMPTDLDQFERNVEKAIWQ